MLFISYLIRLVLTKSLNHYLVKKKSEQTEEKPNMMQKPSWVNIPDNNYNSLIQDVVNNLGNKNHQTTVNN